MKKVINKQSLTGVHFHVFPLVVQNLQLDFKAGLIIVKEKCFNF